MLQNPVGDRWHRICNPEHVQVRCNRIYMHILKQDTFITTGAKPSKIILRPGASGVDTGVLPMAIANTEDMTADVAGGKLWLGLSMKAAMKSSRLDITFSSHIKM